MKFMPTLIACLSMGKGTWTEVIAILHSRDWDKAFLITDQFGKERFTPSGKTELVVVDFRAEPMALKEQIVHSLQGKIPDFEIALNLASGTGNEHMAILEAVMELGLNFRLVTVSEGMVEVMGVKV